MEEKIERLRARETAVAEEERATAAARRDLADQERQLLEKTASHSAAVSTWQVERLTCLSLLLWPQHCCVGVGCVTG